MKIILTLPLLILVSCVTPSRYSPMSETGGYAVEDMGDGVYNSIFSGNGFTSPEKSYYYSRFRAVEYCRQSGFKFAVMLDSKNKSAISTSYNTIHTDYGSYTTPEKILKPQYETLFTCYNKKIIFPASYELKNDAYFMNLADTTSNVALVKKTNKSKYLKPGDLILEINGQKFFEQKDFNEILDNSATKRVKIEILRKKKELIVYEDIIDITTSLTQMNTALIQKLCRSFEELRDESKLCLPTKRGLSQIDKFFSN